MKTKILIFSIFLLSIFLIPTVSADTGTYIINKEYAELDIHTDSNVLIKYDIEMKVTGGNIPWITVGLPDKNFEIKSYSGNVNKVKSNNQGSWSGIRADLDKTYYKGESISFSFTVLQKGFVNYYKENKTSLEFTPCWWDRSIVEDLKITVNFPDELKEGQIKFASPEPHQYQNQKVVWQWNSIIKGERKTIGIVMPLETFPSLKPSSIDFSSFVLWFLFVIFLIVLCFGIIMVFNKKQEYESPSISASGFKKRTRHINMYCPNDKSFLDKRMIKSTEIDFCDMCGGIFLDKGEIEDLIKENVREDDFNTRDIKKFRDTKKDITICPRCDGDFKKVTKTINGNNYSIYVCRDCKGIWLNKGIYDLIKKQRKTQEVEQKTMLVKNKTDYHDDSWWLFYPYIAIPHHYRKPSHHTSHTSSSSSSSSHSSCVACACVVSCACACACAGGGAAGCSPKNKINQISFNDDDKI